MAGQHVTFMFEKRYVGSVIKLFYFPGSCSFVVDFDIHVWDVRRPYIPYASFSEHKDVPTGIINYNFCYLII